MPPEKAALKDPRTYSAPIPMDAVKKGLEGQVGTYDLTSFGILESAEAVVRRDGKLTVQGAVELSWDIATNPEYGTDLPLQARHQRETRALISLLSQMADEIAEGITPGAKAIFC